MTLSLLFKIVIGVLLLLILLSLASGMFFLVKDQGQTDRMAKSLTLRIALSITLFVLLFIGFATGLIKPHGVLPVQTEKALPEQRLINQDRMQNSE